MLRLLKCISLVLALAASLAQAEDVFTQFSQGLTPLQDPGNRHTFEAHDGFRLSWWSWVSPTGSNKDPILFLPGRGYSVFRYMEVINSLLARGHGPIFFLESRHQGFSQDEKPQPLDIRSFDEYVTDDLDFIDGPLQQTLTKLQLPNQFAIIAHSKSGAVVNLAVQKRAQLATKIIYLTPMFGINSGYHVLNAFHDKPLEIAAHFACLVGCGHRHFAPSHERIMKPQTMDQARRVFGRLKEDEHGITSTDVTIHWLLQALQATTRVRPHQSPMTTDTLLISGDRDSIVKHESLYDFACASDKCTMLRLNTHHDIQASAHPVYDILIDKMDEFLTTGGLQPFPASTCAQILKSP